MEIYLIRHTETIAEKGICYGQSDLPLKIPYLHDFESISQQINIENPVIFTSPSSRCSVLSDYLHNIKKSRQPIKHDDRLKELNFGQWELKKWSEINAISLKKWSDDFVNQAPPGGESFHQLNQRVNGFIESTLLTIPPDIPVIIVTHAGVIRCILCYSQHVRLKDSFNLQVHFGDVIKIDINKNDLGSELKI